MSLRSLGRTVSLLLFVWAALMGCGSDSSGPDNKDKGPSDFSGLWSLQLEVIAKRTCGNGIGETFTLDASITQEENAAILRTL
jgi:hypothetical protein